MPETISPGEVAHTVVHARGHEHSNRREGLIEVGEAVLLAIVAIATAWSGYQTGKWDGRQAHHNGLSNKYRVQTDSATTRATLRPLWMTSRRPGAPTVQSEMLGTSTRRTALAGLVDRSGAGRRSARLVEHRIRSSLLDRLLVREAL